MPGLRETPFWMSSDALLSPILPKHLMVVGGGFVACERGQTHRRLGVQVTLFQEGNDFSHR
ncbi:MAG: FAD-dependent oxidoreductase [Leptospirales bacterium]